VNVRRTLFLLLVTGLALQLPGIDVDARGKEPDIVVVQHALIAYKGRVPHKKIERTKKEAKALAEKLFDEAQAEGFDFDAMVKEYTADSYPGIYQLTNDDAPIIGGAHQRKAMASRFGDVSFELEIGGVGLASYSSTGSPYGWHIIKRLE